MQVPWEPREAPLATPEERVATRVRLATWYPAQAANALAVEFLYAESKATFDVARDGMKNIDLKAATLITLLSTGLGAVALLGDASKLPARTPWLYGGLVLLAIALFAAVASLPTRPLSYPRLSDYALPGTLLLQPDAKTRVALELSEAWLRDTSAANRVAAGKARLFTFSAFLVVAGVIALMVNFVLGTSGHP